MRFTQGCVRRSGTTLFVGTLAIFITLFSALFAASNVATAQEANWIWSSAHEKDKVPAESCYFRKAFEMGKPEEGQVEINCDDSYELFVNGRPVATGANWKSIDVHNVTKYLIKGRNVIAVKGTSSGKGNAALAVRLMVKETGNTHVVYASDATWKCSLKEFTHWEKPHFNDAQWVAAKVWGEMGMTLPWGDEAVVAGRGKSRFTTPRDFEVTYLTGGKTTGSLIAMTFNEQGNLLASQEKGPLLILRDAAKNGKYDAVSVYCDQIKNCHGMLCLNGKVLAIGDGPDGIGLYRLSDTKNAGTIDKVEILLKFTAKMVEHGPHAPILGPDGFVYIMVGNHGSVEKTPETTSPYQHPYEGELFSPRYEDPSGHAAGIKGPGGTILRTDPNGSFVEVFAGGFRNPYRVAFNRSGELFTWDSDMEWDEGLSWFKQTRLMHVTPGGECGWRSGWTNWHEYYHDALPALIETGRGSPTGVVAYNHVMFPVRYHDALFMGDWGRGRILAVRLKPADGSYTAEAETIVEGRPLNVTDLAVGPDGGLYFCTGGRDTEGGVYRLNWLGKVPPAVTDFGTGLTAALRQPQLDAAWSRQAVSSIKRQLGKDWEPQLIAATENRSLPIEQRLRALDLMHLLGPFPKADRLLKLSGDSEAKMRSKATFMLGIHGDESTKDRLVALLADSDPEVQRRACEALVRSNQTPPLQKLLPLLGSTHRHVAFAARRTLEQIPKDEWRAQILASENQRVFIQGTTALLALDPDKETAIAVVARGQKLLRGTVADPEFLDLLRVFELACSKGELTVEDVPTLGQQMADEYPSKDHRMNRELLRLAIYLQEPSFLPRMIEQINSPELPLPEKLHAAFHSRFLSKGWDTNQKLELLKFFELARSQEGGHSVKGYIENVSRDYFALLTEVERAEVLAKGSKWPSSALSVLARLPAQPGDITLAQLRHLDESLRGNDSESAKKLGIGIVAVLARSGEEESISFLHKLYDKEPERRQYIAMALSQQANKDNWSLLVNSLSIVEGVFAQEVLLSLTKIEQAPDMPEPYRQVILRGLKLGERGGSLAIRLLEHWTNEKVGTSEDGWEKQLAGWQAWFAKKYPDQPEAVLPDDSGNHWTFDELMTFLNTSEGKKGNVQRGAAVFAKANCVKCHRFGPSGDAVGPDLTTVTQRFQTKEIVESVLFPSQVIADRYASKTVLTQDGKIYSGIVGPQGDDSVVVMQADLQRIIVRNSQIESTVPSKKSAMPEGLFNRLTLEEIADLFAYLNQSTPSAITRRTVGPPTK